MDNTYKTMYEMRTEYCCRIQDMLCKLLTEIADVVKEGAAGNGVDKVHSAVLLQMCSRYLGQLKRDQTEFHEIMTNFINEAKASIPK